jgi:hypothetical protein
MSSLPKQTKPMASLLLNPGRVALATRVVPRVVAGLAPRAGRAVNFGLGAADFRQLFVYDWYLPCMARDRVFSCKKNFQKCYFSPESGRVA